MARISQQPHEAVPDGDSDVVRLALCSAGELFGGVERQLLGLCTYAQRRTGRFPLLVLFHDKELARQARALGAAPIVLKGRHRYDMVLVRTLESCLAAAHANVVHAHGYKAMIACALARRHRDAGRRAGSVIPRAFAVLKTEHGRPEPTGANPVAWCKSRVNHFLDDWATERAADTVCYVTSDLARHGRPARGGVRREVIHNGIDPLDRDAFSRPADLEPGFLHLAIVGRATKIKGIPVALRALASEDVSREVRLSIIGSGPCEEPLRREAAALGLGERVRFLGFRSNVYDYIAHLDGLLMPSLHEGLPYTLLEAMSLGVPLIASHVGGLAEVLRDGETGLLIPPGSVPALRAGIVRFAAEPSWRRALGTAAAAVQRRDYTLDAMGDKYWRLYVDMLTAA